MDSHDISDSSTPSDDTTNGDRTANSDELITPPAHTEKSSQTAGLIPYRKGDGRKRGPRPLEQRRRYQAAFAKIVTRMEWERTILTMLRISQDDKNRQAVAAATWISDRICGPVAQQIMLTEVAAITQEEKAQYLRARLFELEQRKITPPDSSETVV